MSKKNFLIYKLMVLFLLAVTGIIIPGRILAMDWTSIKPEYMGTSIQYGTETGIILYVSDYVDHDNRQLKLFAGKNIADSLQMEYEFVVVRIREHWDWYKKDETLFGFQAGIIYDFLRLDHLNLYTGISAGLGYINHPSGYVELAPENPFGLIEGKLGIEYKLNKKIFLRTQAGLWHISSVFRRDNGHNCLDYSLHLGYRF